MTRRSLLSGDRADAASHTASRRRAATVRPPVGSEYVAGPVTTAPRPDGKGTHMITLGAFMEPLMPGKHIVSISGGVFGAGVQAALWHCLSHRVLHLHG